MNSKIALVLIVSTALGAATAPALAQPPAASADDPSKPNPYRDGMVDLKAGRYKEADKNFEQILVRTPDDPQVLMLSGMAMAGMNNLKGAQRAYEHALRKSDNLDIHRELAITLVKLGDVKGAQSELAKLKKSEAACKGACTDAANLKVAVALVEKAISLAPPKAG